MIYFMIIETNSVKCTKLANPMKFFFFNLETHVTRMSIILQAAYHSNMEEEGCKLLI